MPTPFCYYLVDNNGTQLSARYERAVTRLHSAFVRKFPKPSDPTDISNAVEETARRVARYEMTRGEVKNLDAFIIRAYSNVVNSMFRRGRYASREASASDRDLEALISGGLHRDTQRIENAILFRQTLDMLDERKRQLVILTAAGFTAREISARLGISEANVNTSLHRARAKVRHA